MPKPLRSYEDVKSPRKPKPKKGVKKVNAKRGGRRFPENVDDGLRDYVRMLPCVICGSLERSQWCGPTEAAHVKSKGAGGKDWDNLIPLGTHHHREQHVIGIKSFEFKYQVRLKSLARVMTAAYLKTRGFQ